MKLENDTGKKDGQVRTNFVIVKCNKCGAKMSFCPSTVVYLRPCECGNNDYGSPTLDWVNDKYGDFKAISTYDLRLPIWGI